MDKLTLFSKGVELAESRPGDDIHAKFCLCDFNTNRNGTRLNRDTIESWVSTIVNKPLVGRIRGGDFTGHNMKVVNKIDDDGNAYRVAEFDTEAFGTFTGYAIETVGDEEVITATCDIWSRFPAVCELIRKRFEEGVLHTSWEVAVNEYHMDENHDKVIDDGRFTGLCVLGARTPPAYESSMMIEAAETDIGDREFVDAFESDLSSKNEESTMEDFEISTEEVVEETIEQVETSAEEKESQDTPVEEREEEETAEEETQKEEPEQDPEEEETAEKEPIEEEPEDEVETSALTTCDIMNKIHEILRPKRQFPSEVFPEEHTVWAKSWEDEMNELDYLQYTYEVVNDEVTLSDPTKITLVVSVKDINTVISEKSDAIVTATQKIADLESEVAELHPYKEAADKAKHEESEKKLRELAERSGMFESAELESGEIATMIAELDESKLKLCIADRYIATTKSAKSVETASAVDNVPERNLYNEEETYTSLLTAYINKK